MPTPRTTTRLSTGLVGAAATGALVLSLSTSPALAATPPVGLGTAASFAVLAATTVTNTGPSDVAGDLGVSPGLAVTGFPPGRLSGVQHRGDAVALGARDDLVTAYVDAAGRSRDVDQTGVDLGGQTLVPGVYGASTSMSLTGTVTLDAQGDPDAVFVFQAGSTLTTSSGSSVSLVGSAQPCNVWWQVGSSATLGTSSRFVGTVMALTSATLQTGASLEGRVLARNGQVSLDTNTITRPGCATSSGTTPGTAPTPVATPTATPTATSTPTSTPTGGTATGGQGKGGATQSTGAGGRGDGGAGPTTSPTPTVPGSPTDGSGTDGGTGSGVPDDGTGRDTVVPVGHPETGRAPGAVTVAPTDPLGARAGLALLAAAGAGLVVGARVRATRRRT